MCKLELIHCEQNALLLLFPLFQCLLPEVFQFVVREVGEVLILWVELSQDITKECGWRLGEVSR